MAGKYLVATVGGAAPDQTGNVPAGEGGGDLVFLTESTMDGNTTINIALPIGYSTFRAYFTGFGATVNDDNAQAQLKIRLANLTGSGATLSSVGDYKGILTITGLAESDVSSIANWYESVSINDGVLLHTDVADTFVEGNDHTSGVLEIRNAASNGIGDPKSIEGFFVGRRTTTTDAIVLKLHSSAMCNLDRAERLIVMVGGTNPAGTVRLYGIV